MDPDLSQSPEVYPYGTAKLSHADGSNFKVNCHHLSTIMAVNTPLFGYPGSSKLSLRTTEIQGIESSFTRLWFSLGKLRGTDISKNHKKTVKNGQAQTRESVEYKVEARKVKPQSKSAKKSQKLAQHVTSKNDMLAILRCPQNQSTTQDNKSNH
ncbi:hypothetical protein Tco_0378397 [Tanacetum coccineum]